MGNIVGRNRKLALQWAIAAVCVLCLGTGTAVADPLTLNFYCIASNGPLCPTLGSQFSVVASDAGDHQASFTFYNAGPVASSITDIYFDDGVLSALASVVNGPGVAFSQYATPSDLPGGNNASPPFVTTSGFSADSDSPIIANGVQPGLPQEWVELVFDIDSGMGFSDVESALASGDLRIGIHVQSIGGGDNPYSCTFITTPPAVPEPGTAALVMAGIALVGFRVRRRLRG